MSLKTANFKLYKYEDNDIGDLRFLHDSMDTIDKGIVLDVGDSTGTGNNYVLDIGNLVLKKGMSLKFWADKNSTGAVTINGTYHLVKDNGNSIKNIKKNAPYIITFNGNTSFFLSSGGADESDSTTVGIDGSKVLAGETFIGSDGEIHTGTIPIRNAVNTTLKAGQSVTLDSGYYKDKSTIKAETLSTAMTNAGATLTSANQLINGVKAIGKDGKLITGTATIQSLGGLKKATGKYSPNTTNEVTINVGFKPSVILLDYMYKQSSSYKNGKLCYTTLAEISNESYMNNNPYSTMFNITPIRDGFKITADQTVIDAGKQDITWFAIG